jgi:hypothetical protein
MELRFFDEPLVGYFGCWKIARTDVPFDRFWVAS